MQVISMVKATSLALTLTTFLYCCVIALPRANDDVFAVIPHDSLNPVQRTAIFADGKEENAVNGHDVRANFERLARSSQKIEEATRRIIEAVSSKDQIGLYSWKLILIQEVVALGGSLRATIEGLDQTGKLTDKAIGRIRPLLKTFRVASDAFTQGMESNADALTGIGAEYVPKCFVGPYGDLLPLLQRLLVLKTNGYFKAEFEEEVEQIISNIKDIEDHFPRYADAQTCAAAQAKAGDPPSTSYDLSGLYTLM